MRREKLGSSQEGRPPWLGCVRGLRCGCPDGAGVCGFVSPKHARRLVFGRVAGAELMDEKGGAFGAPCRAVAP